tara:strand:+ start:1226 stop:1474 length:249 start_codon:yes stop_codon:yes gene_type:complete
VSAALAISDKSESKAGQKHSNLAQMAFYGSLLTLSLITLSFGFTLILYLGAAAFSYAIESFSSHYSNFRLNKLFLSKKELTL